MQDQFQPEIRVDRPAAIAISADQCCISGWAYDRSNRTKKLILEVEGTRLPIYWGLRRDDVADILADEGARHCGFVVRFRRPLADSCVDVIGLDENSETCRLKVACPAPDVSTTDGKDRYMRWLSAQEPILYNQSARLFRMGKHRPTFSLLTFAQNIHPYLLSCCLRSLQQQIYPHFRCVIFRDSPTDQFEDAAVELILRDDRFVLCGSVDVHRVFAEDDSDYFAFLDGNDELDVHALREFALEAVLESDPKAINADEDTIDIFGRLSDPVFKTAFDAACYLSRPNLGEFVAFHRSAKTLLPGGGPGDCRKDSAELLLRIFETYGQNQIRHVAKPIHHRRIPHPYIENVPTSSADDALRDSLVTAHLQRTEAKAVVRRSSPSGSLRIVHERTRSISVAIVVPLYDLDQQRAILRLNARGCQANFYTLNGIGLRRVDSDGSSRTISSIAEIAEDVMLFVNQPLETVNHFFLDELSSQAMRRDVGVATAVSVDVDAKIVHSGFLSCSDRTLIDPYLGLPLSSPVCGDQIDCLREVTAVHPILFATRTEFLARTGGLGAVSDWSMHRLVSHLCSQARGCGEKVIVTPFAIATFEGPLSITTDEVSSEPCVYVNPNLVSWLRGGPGIETPQLQPVHKFDSI